MMKKWILALLALALVCAVSLALAETFTIEVQYGQTEARSMLEAINAHRTADTWYWNETDTEKITVSGLAPLVYDKKLEDAAMRRAAEIAIFYSHTRPDGSSCFTIYPSGATGENIAAGYRTAAAVFEGWWEENKPYSGQGHRRNLLSANATGIGIGHVMYNGYHYWTQAIGKSAEAPGAAADGYQQISITVATDNISAVGASGVSLSVDDTKEIPNPGVCLKSTWPSGTYCPVQGLTVTWNTPADGLFSVSGNEITALAVGETSLTGTAALNDIPLGVEARADVRIGCARLSGTTITLDDSNLTYTGEAVEPPVTITSKRGHTLLEGVDYTLKYQDNITCSGLAFITITGQGNYTGMEQLTFSVKPVDISTGVAIDPLPAQTYTGSRFELSRRDITGTFRGKKLDDGWCYIYEQKDNRDVGTATVIVKGSGNFKGEKTLTFEILPLDFTESGELELNAYGTTEDYTVNETVMCSGRWLQRDVDYTLAVAVDAEGNGTVTVTGTGNYTGTLTGTFKVTVPEPDPTEEPTAPPTTPPANPDDPASPTTPPTDPDDPASPTVPPADPDDPASPTVPPVDPDDPASPTVPADPDDPTSPTTPPTDPDDPAVPVTPDDPEEPDGEMITDSTGSYWISGDTAVFDSPARETATVKIPATVTVDGKKYKVTAIEAYAFEKNTKLKKVVIGKYVKTIGESAFEGCTKLKTVTGGAAVATVGKYAFLNCKAMTKLPSFGKLKTVGVSAFQGCKALTKITLNKYVKTIGAKAFYKCAKLKSIVIKTTKLTSKTVGGSAFKGVYKKAVVKVPAKKLKAYKTLLKKKGLPKTAKVKK